MPVVASWLRMSFVTCMSVPSGASTSCVYDSLVKVTSSFLSARG